MVAWFNADPVLSNLGVALIVASILLEMVEIHMSHGGFGAVVVGMMMVPLFGVITFLSYLGLSALMKGVPPPPADWDKLLVNLYTGLIAWGYNWRVILSGAIGASFAVMFGEGLALMFVPTLKVGKVGAERYRSGASESARSDSVIMGIQFAYVLVIVFGAIFSTLV
jgi:hypothetical protein